MSMVQINFNFVAPFKVIVSRVDPTSKQESQVGAYGSGVITQSALPGTEWRFTEMGNPHPFQTYVTTDAPTQQVEIGRTIASPPASAPVTVAHVTPAAAPVTAAHVTPGAAPVTDPHVITVPLTPAVPVTHSPATPVTVTVTPGVAITGTLSNPSIALHPTTPPPGGIPLVGARGSIFNSDSFDMNMINLEREIRQQTGLTDNNKLRAAIYARLVEIVIAPNRTRDEQAVADWLAKQVKNARVEAARLALAEYDKWNSDPWSYVPPQGYDFPAYVIQPRSSYMWLTTTPIPPGLDDTSWQSFIAGIISSNGWSPLNNPLLTKGSTSKSVPMIGFPAFGTALAYQKLYGTPDGVRVFAETTANLVSESFTLHAAFAGGGAPVEGAMTSVVRLLFLKNIAPYSYRNINALVQQIKQLASGAGEGKGVTFAPGTKAGVGTSDLPINSMTDTELRAALAECTVGDIISSFVASLMIAVAIQGIISESFMLVNKIELRGKLVAEFDKQRSAPLPDLSNLFFYDKPVVLGAANWIAPDPDGDYQPTDPVELERLMGSQEANRAFLLATL